MSKIVLIGCEESKRTSYFLKAASKLKEEIEFCDIRHINKEKLLGKAVKIDPSIYGSCDVENLNFQVSDYLNTIMELYNIPGIRFLNTPKSIMDVLSKKSCKKVLLNNNISTTNVLDFNIKSYDDLREKIILNKVYNVFIKPDYGSGAAGVAAYRCHPNLNKETIYTSVNISGSKLINTKQIKKYEDKGIIKEILNKIISGNALVERWIPKAEYLDFTYDLRVVVQFGRVDFIAGRLSKNPITNLHLNNNAVNINELALTEDKLQEIKELCIKSVHLFDGLNAAGVDVLLTKNSLRPMIIEINAQGDLIYQDIYNQNSIYTNQILGMREFICAKV